MPSLAIPANEHFSRRIGAPLVCLACALAVAPTFAGPGAGDSTGASPPTMATQEWTATPPCSPEHARLLPGQPALGLALYRFECPGAPSRLLSAKRQVSAVIYAATEDLTRGANPQLGKIYAAGEAKVSRSADMPLSPTRLGSVQARRPISKGEPLLERDFEPRKLWIGGEAVTVLLRQGAVSTTMPGQSLGVGRLGESASARVETGKVFSGVAALHDGAPRLEVELGSATKVSP